MEYVLQFVITETVNPVNNKKEYNTNLDVQGDTPAHVAIKAAESFVKQFAKKLNDKVEFETNMKCFVNAVDAHRFSKIRHNDIKMEDLK